MKTGDTKRVHLSLIPRGKRESTPQSCPLTSTAAFVGFLLFPREGVAVRCIKLGLGQPQEYVFVSEMRRDLLLPSLSVPQLRPLGLSVGATESLSTRASACLLMSEMFVPASEPWSPQTPGALLFAPHWECTQLFLNGPSLFSSRVPLLNSLLRDTRVVL